LELFWTLTQGFLVILHGQLNTAPEDTSAQREAGTAGTMRGSYPDTTPLSAKLLEYSVSHLQCTPSFMNMLLMDPEAMTALKGLSHILLGGEELPFSLVKQIQTLTTAKLHNMYGPTETTIWSTTTVISSSLAHVSLGYPIVNTQIYLLDAHLQPVPVGAAGEIYIGGEGLARGYLNQSALTAERFLPNPFVGVSGQEPRTVPTASLPCACPGGRLYRTGDVARYHADGQLEYLGRRDQQVKLRGHRIELGEIEASLRAYPAIHEAVVVLREEDQESLQKYLLAYMVAEGEERPTQDDLSSHLRRQLPHYMVPASMVFLERLPLSPNGKIDRNALPIPDRSQFHENSELVPPQTPLQEQLAIIWAELLRLPQVGIHHNFFELGGHSLLATRLIARLQTIFQVELPLHRFFETPTIVGIAQAIEQIQSERIEQTESEELAQMFISLGGLSEDEVQTIFANEA
jgi:acyl-CoA synthetase (AMP-forming)/AMP-acid ligase II